MSNLDAQKRVAARAALNHVKDGMKLGLGTGSTAKHFVDGVGKLVADGMDLVCVPTSEATKAQAESLNIPLSTLDALKHLDLTVDGADELTDSLELIKGGGGALLREKIVANASDEMIVIADNTKHVDKLGKYPLPVEIVVFGAQVSVQNLRNVCNAHSLSGEIVQRMASGAPFLTDGGNFIFDCHFGAIPNPQALAEALKSICGVVEHGLFIGLSQTAYIATDEGTYEVHV
ncbi:MAG: ribose-5-phosphate isomerase RpiA [Hyphomicrobiales bacterium]